MMEFGTLFHFIRNGLNIRQSKSASGLPITRIETIATQSIDPARVGYAGLTEESCSTWLLEPGDILFSHINSISHIGKCAVYRGTPAKLVHGMNLLCLRCDTSRLLPEFAKHLIRSTKFRRQLSSYINKAVNQASISISNLRSIQVSVPSLSEQSRIAEVLDRAETLRNQRRSALAQLDTFTQAIFAEMFGDHQIILKRWKSKKLDDLLNFLTSGSRGWADHYSESGDLFLRIQNVGHDELILDEVAFVKAPDTAEAKRTRVSPGDVLLSITADLGRTAVVPDSIGNAFINQHLSILRTTAMAPRFLSAYLSSPAGQHQIASRNKQGVKAGLNFDDIRSLIVPLPPPALQHEFELRTETIGRLRDLHRSSLAEMNSLFGSLQYRAFQGNL